MASSQPADVAGQLAKLEKLRLDGALSDHDFQQLKAKLISESVAPASAPNPSRLPDPPMISFNDVSYETHGAGVSYATPFVAIAIVLLAFFSYPLFNEGVGNECSALEVNALRTASKKSGNERNQHANTLVVGFARPLQRASNRAFVSDLIKSKYPNLPASIGCTVGYYQLLFSPDDWRNFNTASDTNSSEAEIQNEPDTSVHLSPRKNYKQHTPRDTGQNNEDSPAALKIMSADDLAFGLDKLHWGMTVKDAKILFPMLNGLRIEPGQPSATLSLDKYVYARCTFTVQFLFNEAKLSRVEIEADNSVNFKVCHAQIKAALIRQYGGEPGGISPASLSQGYSVHGEWRGLVTDVAYNELLNTVIEVSFSPTYASP